MRWNEKLRKAPSKVKEEWTTNTRVQEEWETHVRKRVRAKNTQRNHLTYLGVFFRSFGDLVTTLEREDVEAFVERIGTKCAKLINGEEPQCLAKLPIATCPVLHGRLPFSSCPRYKPLEPSGVWSYICSINRFYEWLLEEGRVKANPYLKRLPELYSSYAPKLNL